MRLLTKAFLPFCLLALASGSTIPRPAPEFVIRMPTAQVLLSQFRGKVILLSFIHTTCPHCQQAVGVINQIQKDYAPRGFQALGSAFNDSAQQLLPDFLARFRPNYPVGYTSRDSVVEYLQIPANTPMYVPILVFIDRKGMIRQQHLGNNDKFLEDLNGNARGVIESLVKESASPKHKK